jgi:hypothetical protein
MSENNNLWYLKSKGIWSGILLILYSIYEYWATSNFDPTKFLMGLGIIGIRHKQEKQTQ